MTSRERVLSAIRHHIPDRMPIDAISVENQAAVAGALDIDPGDVLERLGLDGRIVSATYTGSLPEPEDGIPFTEWDTPGTGDYGTARSYPLTGAASLREIERYAWPDAGQYDFARAGETAERLGMEYAVRGPYWMPLFCRVCDLVGMEEAMAWMLLKPGLFEAMLERVFTFTAEFCDRLLTACGDHMPILCLGDDFATQRGMMINPETWRKFLKPRYASLFEIGKRHGKVVWFHSCGDITAILPDLIDIGMDVWETVQLHALPIAPEKLKRNYGQHITFFGGVNTQRLPFITPEEVRDEVKTCIEMLGRDGGYICGPDHHVKGDVSAENTIALFETAKGFRGEGYTRARI